MTEPSPHFRPPYYMVVLSSKLRPEHEGYATLRGSLIGLASKHPGYLGHDVVDGADRQSVVMSYWADEESIQAWRKAAMHITAKKRGLEEWYSSYTVHVAKVERAYGLVEGRPDTGA